MAIGYIVTAEHSPCSKDYVYEISCCFFSNICVSLCVMFINALAATTLSFIMPVKVQNISELFTDWLIDSNIAATLSNACEKDTSNVTAMRNHITSHDLQCDTVITVFALTEERVEMDIIEHNLYWIQHIHLRSLSIRKVKGQAILRNVYCFVLSPLSAASWQLNNIQTTKVPCSEVLT